MMKKRYLIIAVTITLVILASIFLFPLGIGFLVEKEYPQIAQTFSKTDDIQVSVLNYHRGWFHSTATIKVLFTKPSLIPLNKWLVKQQGNPIEIVVKQDIAHGPWLMANSSKFSDKFYIGQALIKSDINPEFGKIDAIAVLKIMGDTLFLLNADAIQYQQQQGVAVMVKGLNAHVNFARNLKAFQGEINLPHIFFSDKKIEQEIDDLKAQFNLRADSHGLFLGEQKIEIGTMRLNAAPDSNLELKKLLLQSYSKAVKSKVSYQIHASLENLQSANVAHGSQTLAFAVKDLDIEQLVNLKKAFNQLQPNIRLSAMELVRYNEIIMRLLGKGLQIDIDNLLLSMYGSKTKVMAQIILQPQTNVTMNLKQFLSFLTAKVHVEISKKLLSQTLEKLDQTPIGKELGITVEEDSDINDTQTALTQNVDRKMSEWVKKDWLSVHGGDYHFDFNFKDGKSYINGQPWQQDKAANG